jgi:hypothetical protein
VVLVKLIYQTAQIFGTTYFGSSNDFLSILCAVHVDLSKNEIASIKSVDMQDRWLVIKYN